MNIDGQKGRSSDIEEDNEDNFIDIAPKRQKTFTYFHSPAK